MAFNPVPWAITGSALDTFVMRQFANMATRDSEGIQLPGDCKVTATGTASGFVNVAAGGLVIRNVQAAAAGDGQSYVGRVTSDTLVAVPPTGGSGRSDLIIATVKDPDFSPWGPWPGGTDPNVILYGPYFFPERIPGISGATTKANQAVAYSAYALARLDIPPGITNILNSMIVDLRGLAQPRNGFARAVQPAAVDSLTTSSADQTFNTFPNNTLAVTVPTWATHCVASIKLNQVRVQGAANFQSRVNIGGLTGVTSDFNYLGNSINPSFDEGVPFEIFGDIDVRALAGQTVVVQPQSRRTQVGNNGQVRTDANQQVVYDLMFVERTV